MRHTSEPGPSPEAIGEPRTWRNACADFAAEQGLPDELVAALDAFRSPWPRGGSTPKPETRFAGTFGELEARVTSSMPDQVGLLATLEREVDSEQAAMFVRRLAAVDERLSSVVDPAVTAAKAAHAAELEAFLTDEEVQSLAEGESAQSSGAALTAPALGLDEDFEPTEEELAAFLAEEDSIELAHEVLGVSEDQASRERTQAFKYTRLSPSPSPSPSPIPQPSPQLLLHSSDTSSPQYRADDPSRGAHGATAASYRFS